MRRETFRAQDMGILPATKGNRLVRAVFELDTSETSIHVMPLGPNVTTRDNRAFHVTDLARIVANSELPLLLDWEHRSEFSADTKAAGWISGLSIDYGTGRRRAGVWGAVEWTPEGLRDVKAKAYRYLSPVLILDRESRDVLSIASVALTNRPALDLSLISAESFSARKRSKGHTTMATTEISSTVRAQLHASGLSDNDIATAQAYRAQQRAEAGTVTSELLPAARAALKASGLSDNDIANAQAYRAQQLAEVGQR